MKNLFKLLIVLIVLSCGLTSIKSQEVRLNGVEYGLLLHYFNPPENDYAFAKKIYSDEMIDIYLEDSVEYNGRMLPVKTINSDFFLEKRNLIKSISIPGTINIVTFNFPKCENLTKLEFREGVKSLDAYHLAYNCPKLEEVKLPRSLKKINSSCFNNCPANFTLDLPNLTSICDSCFLRCDNLTKAYIPNVESIGEDCFCNCKKLRKIYGNNLTSIGKRCFNFCSSLTDIVAPILRTIPESSFNNCTSLTTIDMPIVTTVNNSSFNNCTSLTTINIPYLQTIDYNSFSKCTSLKSVYLPYCKKIMRYVFAYCTQLETVDFDDKEVASRDLYIEHCAFIGSPNIINLIFPRKLKSLKIESNTFTSLNAIKSITLPENTILNSNKNLYLSYSTSQVFSNAPELESVYMGGNVIFSGDEFRNCSKLKSIYIYSSLAEYPAEVMYIADNFSWLDNPDMTLYLNKIYEENDKDFLRRLPWRLIKNVRWIDYDEDGNPML